MTPYAPTLDRSQALALRAGALEEQQFEIHRIMRGGLPDPHRAAVIRMALDTSRVRLEALPEIAPH